MGFHCDDHILQAKRSMAPNKILNDPAKSRDLTEAADATEIVDKP